MAISVFDLFSIGIGPSSSHTVGPMRAAHRFVHQLADQQLLDATTRIAVELFGSLAATGRGHGTDRAVLMGLEGEEPETIEPQSIDGRVEAITTDRRLRVLGHAEIVFDARKDLVFNRRKTLPFHPNGMSFKALGTAGEVLHERVYYSVGGGFVVNETRDQLVADTTELPHPFHSGADLLDFCQRHNLSIAEIMMANERAWRDEDEIRRGLLDIAAAMHDCIETGCHAQGVLPGVLKVPRRAPSMYRTLAEWAENATAGDPLAVLDWVSLFAIAVNEENAAGGRVVTAPTNGAAGIVPAVLEYYRRFITRADDDGIVRFLLTAGAIGILVKENASISGAEVGCQGEVGVACSMAAAGLTAMRGGTPAQVENAAEIGMEHHLGLTCDPVAGLVQIPCIERNAVGATKAIHAARLALHGDGSHKVSLDKVIRTMRQTGADMKTKYKETSRGGLAINVIEC